MSEYTPTTPAEESPVWEAADRLRHHGFPWLAELVEEMARERAKRPDRIEELEKNLSYEVEQKIKLADTLRDERAKRPDREQIETIIADGVNTLTAEQLRELFIDPVAIANDVFAAFEGGRDV